MCVLASFVPSLVLAALERTSQSYAALCEAALLPAHLVKLRCPVYFPALQYALGPWGNFKALLRRDWTLMRRNKFLYT